MPNRNTRDVQELLDRMGCNPFEGMARIAAGDVPCGTCHGVGKTPFRIPDSDKLGQRTCESCYGTMKDKVTPQLRGQMYSELAQYIGSKRKAVELSNPDGTLKPSWDINYIGEKGPEKGPTQ